MSSNYTIRLAIHSDVPSFPTYVVFIVYYRLPAINVRLRISLTKVNCKSLAVSTMFVYCLYLTSASLPTIYHRTCLVLFLWLHLAYQKFALPPSLFLGLLLDRCSGTASVWSVFTIVVQFSQFNLLVQSYSFELIIYIMMFALVCTII